MRKLLTGIWLIAGLYARSQDLSWIRYTLKDGLPGPIVYHALQDANGFMWFATNQGVSRFDGKTFKNFSQKDGLPDDDILGLYRDRYDNIWFISFHGIASVLCDGVIHSIDSCKGVFAVVEDYAKGTLSLLSYYEKDGEVLYGYYETGSQSRHWQFSPHIKPMKAIGDWPILRASTPGGINFYLSSIGHDSCGLTILDKNDSGRVVFPYNRYWGYFPFRNKPLFAVTERQKNLLIYADTKFFSSTVLPGNKRGIIGLPFLDGIAENYMDLNALYLENDSCLWLCTRNKGLVRVNNFYSPQRSVHTFFPSSFCTSILKDREGGYWVTTHNQGVYYLPNPEAYCLFREESPTSNDVKCIRILDKQTIGAGFSDGNIVFIDAATRKYRYSSSWARINKNNRILDLQAYGKHELLVGSDYSLEIVSGKKSRGAGTMAGIKAIYQLSDTAIAIAHGKGLTLLNPRRHVEKGLFTRRVTCVNGIGDRLYWGTLDGMYEYTHDTLTSLSGSYPAVSKIINHIDLAPDSAVWVSTQQGIVLLKEGRCIRIGRQEGLLSDQCKQVSFDGPVAWVATDQGISRLSWQWRDGRLRYTISNIVEEDGLSSSDINQTVIAGNSVWAATSAGISVFPKNYAPHSMQAPLINITAIINDNNERVFSDTVAISYKKNKLQVEIAGISFRSGQRMTYQYRMKELDSNWTTTTGNRLEFSALPAGNYQFEVRARDRWGINSEIRKIYVVVPPPFWKTSLFIFCTYLLMALLVGGAVYLYFRVRYRKRDKHRQLTHRMADLEMMALRAQMNPHFIFNCLSCIQYYVLASDSINANLYLHKFSTLIRSILEHSNASTITLEEEIKMLGLYLELEKLRLGDRLQYSIHVAEKINPAKYDIPSIIIQPYVENAVQHGISRLIDRQGTIRVDFQLENNLLVCTIDDNGIGIAASIAAKKEQDLSHRSMGTGISESRIHIINLVHKNKISLEVIDKNEVEEGGGQGTLVRLRFSELNE